MAVTKPGWLKDSIAKVDGYYSPKGELLKSSKLSQEQVDAWNGVEKKKRKATKKKKPAVEQIVEAPQEETVVEETSDAPNVSISEVEVEEAPKKLFGLFNK